MLYYQRSTLSKIQEAEKMGKKTVPIANQIIPRRRDHIRTKYVIDVSPAANSFKTIRERNR